MVIRLVKTYLLHYGYQETLNAFDLATESALPPVDIAQEGGFNEQEVSFALQDRKNIREVLNLIMHKVLTAFVHDPKKRLLLNKTCCLTSEWSQIKRKFHYYYIFFVNIELIHTPVVKAYREG